MERDSKFYLAAARRIRFLMIALAVGGAAVAYALGGREWAIGYTYGACFSILNYALFKRIAERIGEPAENGPGKATAAVLLGIRYVTFGLLGYVIVKYFHVSFMAAVVGCLVSVAAVIVEILYELTYAGTS